VAPKDRTEKEDQTGVVYHIPCTDCSSVYVGETGRKLKVRLKEHKSIAPSASSPVSAHTKSGHTIDWAGVKNLEKDSRTDTRRTCIREAIHIKREAHPKLNTSQGYQLSPIYSTLLRSEKRTGNSVSGNTSRNTDLSAKLTPTPTEEGTRRF